MKHTIKISDAEQYEFEHQIAGSFGKDEHKELKAVVAGTEVHFEVWSHRKMICNTTRIAEAVTAYNRDA